MSGIRLKLQDSGGSSIGLMGHVIANFPSPEGCREIISVLAAHGAQVIEIQIPFSEPMADGPVFLAANQEALSRGVNYEQSLELMKEVSTLYPAVQFVFMTYLNIIYKRNPARFIQEAVASGARGVIIPDLVLDGVKGSLATEFASQCRAADFTNVQLVPPNCSQERMAALCAAADGLIYAVARTGVTGAKTDFTKSENATAMLLSRLRSHTKVPIAVGFGVKSGDDVRSLCGRADLAVIGTQTLKVYQEQGRPGLEALWDEFAQAGQSLV